jgi:hypothetical protein
MLFRPLSFAFRREIFLPICSPLSGSAKLRSFLLCQAPLYPPPISGQGWQRYEVFDIHKYPPATGLPFIKDHAKSHNQPYPAITRPRFGHSSFSGSAKVRRFSLRQAPSWPYPERDGKVTDFLAFASPYSQRPASPASLFQGAQRYEVFCFVKPPFPPRFSLGSAKVQRF